MGPRQRFFPLVRSNRGYRRGACIRHIAPRAIGAGCRRIGFLSSMLDHFVAVSSGAQTWLRQCEYSCRHGPDFGAAVSMGNVCSSLLYELLDVLSPDLAAVLPHAGTSFFLGRDGEDRWVGLFPDGCRSHVRRMGLRSLHCLRKNSNPGSQDVYGRGTGGGWDLTCCLRRQRASALGSMSAVGGGVLGNQRFQYLGNYSNACGTASSWQVDRAAKLLR